MPHHFPLKIASPEQSSRGPLFVTSEEYAVLARPRREGHDACCAARGCRSRLGETGTCRSATEYGGPRKEHRAARRARSYRGWKGPQDPREGLPDDHVLVDDVPGEGGRNGTPGELFIVRRSDEASGEAALLQHFWWQPVEPVLY